MCVLAVKTCDLSSDVCSSYGFGESGKGEHVHTMARLRVSICIDCLPSTCKGFFLFFLFFGMTMLAFQLACEAAAIAYHIRMQNKLRRLRYRGGRFVELPPVAEAEFAHLPGLEASACYHLFLSHAWPIGQDVCKLIKQRCLEICPSLHVFLDVEDLTSGSGTKEVDHSRCILVFAMPVYFEKINCVKELTRSIVRHKQITLLLPDSEVHGAFTTAMIAEIVTDEWVQKWKLEKKLAEWASNWGVAEVPTPTSASICAGLFEKPPLEWSRITPFQDRTMVLMCRRLLLEAEGRDVFLQGEASFKLAKGHATVNVYCSPHNPGARELAEELNGIWPGLLQTANVSRSCDHMLVYLNALTWTHDLEPFAAEIRQAMHEGLHLQLCHEYPSVTDPGSVRQAVEFKQIMDATPADLKKWPTNIYSQIAIALKGGELREPGLANLAARLAVRVARTPIEAPLPPRSGQEESASGGSVTGLIKTTSRKMGVQIFRSMTQHGVPGAVKSECQADINLGAERPMSCGESWQGARRSASKATSNDAAIGAIRPGEEIEEASAAGAIPRELAVVESSV